MTARSGGDLLIRNAKVHTVDPARPWAEAVAVKAGRIAAVGDDAEAVAAAPRHAQEVDAAGPRGHGETSPRTAGRCSS